MARIAHHISCTMAPAFHFLLPGCLRDDTNPLSSAVIDPALILLKNRLPVLLLCDFGDAKGFDVTPRTTMKDSLTGVKYM